MGRIALNVGAGPLALPDEIGVDQEPTSAVEVRADLLSLPFRSGCADFVRVDHVIEHLAGRLAPLALIEAARVLKAGGVIHVGVPDFAGCCRYYLEQASLGFKALAMRWIYGSQTHPGEFHSSGWDKETLADLLRSVGFADVTVQDDPERSEGVCIFAEGMKA